MSTLKGNLDVIKRTDQSGGNLSVAGTLTVAVDGTPTDILSLVPKTYKHIQAVHSYRWEVTHNLGTSEPDVTIFNENGNEVITTIDYHNATDNTIAILFAYPAIGHATIKRVG